MATTTTQGSGRYPGVPRLRVRTGAVLYTNVVKMEPDPDNEGGIILTTERDFTHRVKASAIKQINDKVVNGG